MQTTLSLSKIVNSNYLTLQLPEVAISIVGNKSLTKKKTKKEKKTGNKMSLGALINFQYTCKSRNPNACSGLCVIQGKT